MQERRIGNRLIMVQQDKKTHISYLPHTADIRMRVTAPDLKRLYARAVEGMNGILKEGFCGRERGPASVETSFEVKGADPSILLVDFLSEVLSSSYADKCLFCRVKTQLEENRVLARLQGTEVDGFDEEIKAVTYHEAQVRRKENGEWEALILFDI